MTESRSELIAAIRAKASERFHPSHPEETRFATPWDIEDESFPAFRQLVTGKTIIKIEREPHSGSDWPTAANHVTITLDDGSIIEFGSWGYDADGCITQFTPSPSEKPKS